MGAVGTTWKISGRSRACGTPSRPSVGCVLTPNWTPAVNPQMKKCKYGRQATNVQVSDALSSMPKTPHTRTIHFADCLEDIVRAIRKHETQYNKPVKLQIAEWNAVEHHILPAVHWEAENEDVVFNALKVLTLLTLPDIYEAPNQSLLVAAQQSFKEAILKKVSISHNLFSGFLHSNCISAELLDCSCKCHLLSTAKTATRRVRVYPADLAITYTLAVNEMNKPRSSWSLS